MLTYHNAISFFGEMYSIGDYRSVRAWAIREFADDPYLEGKTEEDRGKLIDRMVSRSVDLDKISTHVNVMARAHEVSKEAWTTEQLQAKDARIKSLETEVQELIEQLKAMSEASQKVEEHRHIEAKSKEDNMRALLDHNQQLATHVLVAAAD